MATARSPPAPAHGAPGEVSAADRLGGVQPRRSSGGGCDAGREPDLRGAMVEHYAAFYRAADATTLRHRGVSPAASTRTAATNRSARRRCIAAMRMADAARVPRARRLGRSARPRVQGAAAHLGGGGRPDLARRAGSCGGGPSLARRRFAGRLGGRRRAVRSDRGDRQRVAGFIPALTGFAPALSRAPP